MVQENPDEGMINKVIFTDMTYDETSGKLYAVYSLYWMWGGWKYISHIAEVDPCLLYTSRKPPMFCWTVWKCCTLM